MKNLSFLRLFSFILIAVGGFMVYQSLTSGAGLTKDKLGGGFFLLGVGFVLDFFFVWLNRQFKSEAAVRKKYTGQPWMWRSDWRQNFVEPNEYQTNNFTFIFMLVWCALTCPVSFYVLFTENISSRPVLLAVLIFPFFGVLGVLSAIKQRKKLNQVRGVKFHFENYGVIGGQLVGDILVENRALSESIRRRGEKSSFVLTLKNLYVYSTGGENSSTIKNVLWETDKLTEANLSGDFVAIPIKIDVPFDTKPSFFEESIKSPDELKQAMNKSSGIGLLDSGTVFHSNGKFLWELRIEMPLEGEVAELHFEVPMFVTEQSDSNKTADRQYQEELKINDSYVPTSFTMSNDSGETKIVFPQTMKTAGLAFIVFSLFCFVGSVFFGKTIFMAQRSKFDLSAVFMAIELLFFVVLTSVGLILFFLGLYTFLRKTTLFLKNGTITIFEDYSIFKKQTSLSQTDIEKIEIKEAGRSGDKAFYDLKVCTFATTKNKVIPCAIPSRKDALWLIDLLCPPKKK